MYSIAANLKQLLSKKYLCKAPFIGIYISGDGNVTPCCFNRTDIFGNIYDTSLEEILNNSKTKEIRESIENGIFPKGCEICKHHLLNGNKNNSGIITYENLPVKENCISIIEFELSYACNLRCTMCKLNDDCLFVKPVKTGNKKFKIINQIKPFLDNVKLMRFYGGEPFFIEEYYSIWEKVIEINPKCKFIVQTNGTILNKRVKEITSKGIFNINMSLDSLDKQTYESIRLGANFENSISNLFCFKEIATKNHQVMSISVCPMRINWKEIPKILEFCNKHKLHIFFNSVVNPWNLALWSMSKDELLEIINFYSKIKLRTTSLLSYVNNNRWKSFQNLVTFWYNKSKERPEISNLEFISAKNQVTKALLLKLPGISENDIINKVEAILPIITNYLYVANLLEEITKADSNTIYNNFWLKNDEIILENLIQINLND